MLVYRSGEDLVLQMFALHCNSRTQTGFSLPLVDWMTTTAPSFLRSVSERSLLWKEHELTLATPVLSVERLEGRFCAFSKGCFLLPYSYSSVPSLEQQYMFHLRAMCRVAGSFLSKLICCRLVLNYFLFFCMPHILCISLLCSFIFASACM